MWKYSTPTQHIATLSHDAKLTIEMTVQAGTGYLPAEKSRDENAPIGTIPIDAIFSPVKRVNFNVNYARVGQMTDYERLTLEVWTDGSIAPEDAIAFAAKILQNQLKLFINFEDEIEVAAKGRADHGSGLMIIYTEASMNLSSRSVHQTVSEMQISDTYGSWSRGQSPKC